MRESSKVWQPSESRIEEANITQFIEEELRFQIPRLKEHPSIALWCGDNEVIGAIGWYDESKRIPSTMIVPFLYMD